MISGLEGVVGVVSQTGVDAFAVISQYLIRQRVPLARFNFRFKLLTPPLVLVVVQQFPDLTQL